MDLSDIKQLTKRLIQKAQFSKNYLSLLLPLFIVLAAVIFLVLASLVGDRLRKQISGKSISMVRKVDNLTGSVVAGNQWKIEHTYQQNYRADANRIDAMVSKSNQRELLSYELFPEPTDTSVLIFSDFAEQFRSGIERLIEHINGGECPSETELNKNLQVAKTSTQAGGSAYSQDPYRGDPKGVSRAIIDALCLARAKAISVYAGPTNISGYQNIEGYEYFGMEQAVKDCWYYQLGYWITEDVLNSIGNINSGSTSVLNSPVKRLNSVGFIVQQAVSARTGQGSQQQGGQPVYVLSQNDMLVPSLTARISDDEIDVVHFGFSIVIDAKAVIPFIQELCSSKKHIIRNSARQASRQSSIHNQITVLDSQITAIDRQSQNHRLYRYGESAVVRLDLICEYIFDKKGYEDVKPEVVRQQFNDE